ncbi:hypothetical protein [Pseudoxanthomonas mexicana]
MSNKSAAIVRFIANLMPLYQGERHDGHWCARSVQDGTLILPLGPEDDPDDAGWIRLHWQGDPMRQTEMQGDQIAALALERYVRLHGTGASEDAIAAELWFMAKHFHHKTGCDVDLPQLPEPSHPLVRTAKQMGQGVLVNLMSKIAGI